MNIQFNNTDDLHATLVVNLEKADYTEAVDKELKKYQKQVAVKGFRVGHAPIGMVKNMYGKAILADEINKVAGNALYGYLKEHNIDILAQPLPNTAETKADIENDESFTLAFDLGLAPKFELNISDKDSLVKYVISVDDSEIDKEIENLSRRYGRLEAAGEIEEKDIVYGRATELGEDGKALEGGVSSKDISFTPELIKDETTKALFIGKKAGDKVTVNIFTLFNDNPTVINNTLGIAKEAVNDLNSQFDIEITEVKRNIPAVLGTEFYNQVLGEGVADSEEAFRAKIKENLEMYYNGESEHHLEHMLNHLIEDNHHFSLPDNFLKRWLLESKEDVYNNDNIDERYQQESKSLKYILVQEKLAEKYGINVTKEDLEQASLSYTLSLFRNYGLQNPDFNLVKKYSDDSLKKPEHVQQMNDIALRRKVLAQIKTVITIKEQPISIEDFYKEINEHNHQH